MDGGAKTKMWKQCAKVATIWMEGKRFPPLKVQLGKDKNKGEQKAAIVQENQLEAIKQKVWTGILDQQ